MGALTETWDDTETPGLSVDYDCHLTDVIPGARDTISEESLGPPIEDTCEIYVFTVKCIRLYDVEFPLDYLNVEGRYGDVADLVEDVTFQMIEWIQQQTHTNSLI